jgi:hypothetical protein
MPGIGFDDDIAPHREMDVPGEVRLRVGRFAGRTITKADDPKTLTKNLGMKHPACMGLSRSLDRFVKKHNRAGRVRLVDIEKDTATVGSTILLVDGQIRVR